MVNVSSPAFNASVVKPFRMAPRWSFLPIFFSIRQKAQLIESLFHGLPSELSRSAPRILAAQTHYDLAGAGAAEVNDPVMLLVLGFAGREDNAIILRIEETGFDLPQFLRPGPTLPRQFDQVT